MKCDQLLGLEEIESGNLFLTKGDFATAVSPVHNPSELYLALTLLAVSAAVAEDCLTLPLFLA